MITCNKYLFVVVVCGVCSAVALAATIKAETPTRLTRRSQQNHEYSPAFGIKSQNTITYETQAVQSVDTFHTQPQISKQEQQLNANNKLYTSYVPPASGTAAYYYSSPQASQSVALPKNAPPPIHETTKLSMSTPLLMVEEPLTTTFLSKQQNDTLAAAQLIASSLLQAAGEAPLQTAQHLQVTDDASKLNKTDLVIVKSQKNAYIIPTQLAKDAQNPAVAQEIYRMRDNLQKAYTVNQFIFIIKPEKINFLNKLV